MKKQSYTVMANWVISDAQLYPSTKRVLFAMLSHCNRHDIVRKTVAELADLSHCCASTVGQALAQLEERGLIRKQRNYRYSRFLSRVVNDKSSYKIARSKLEGSYTLIPRSLLDLDITHSTFVAAMYIYKVAGRDGRCYPSLRLAAEQTDLSKATICRALAALRQLQVFVRRFCEKVNDALSCNSYFPTEWVRSHGGCLNFSKHQVINKITLGLYLEGKVIGSGGIRQIAQFAEDFAVNLSAPKEQLWETHGGSIPFLRQKQNKISLSQSG